MNSKSVVSCAICDELKPVSEMEYAFDLTNGVCLQCSFEISNGDQIKKNKLSEKLKKSLNNLLFEEFLEWKKK